MPLRFSPSFLASIQRRLEDYIHSQSEVQDSLNRFSAKDEVLTDALIQAIMKQCPAEDKVSIIKQTIYALQTQEVIPLLHEFQNLQSETEVFELARNNMDNIIALCKYFSARELEILKSGPLVLTVDGKQYQFIFTPSEGGGHANILPV